VQFIDVTIWILYLLKEWNLSGVLAEYPWRLKYTYDPSGSIVCYSDFKIRDVVESENILLEKAFTINVSNGSSNHLSDLGAYPVCRVFSPTGSFGDSMVVTRRAATQHVLAQQNHLVSIPCVMKAMCWFPENQKYSFGQLGDTSTTKPSTGYCGRKAWPW
jgi:hypothetical protein